MTNGVEYMDGGKSVAEVKFLQMVAPRWAAVLQFAVNKGPQNAFPADVKVSVHDKHTGRPVMETTASGPVMLVRLDEGTYGVQATVGDLTLTQSLTVSEGASAKALFLWPSNFDFAAVSASENQRQAAKKAVLSQARAKADPVAMARDRQAAVSSGHD